jgi:hypothetical protein
MLAGAQRMGVSRCRPGWARAGRGVLVPTCYNRSGDWHHERRTLRRRIITHRQSAHRQMKRRLGVTDVSTLWRGATLIREGLRSFR